MKLTIREVSEIKREIEVVVPAEEVNQAFDAVYEKIGKKAKLKGFRPGKVPRPVLEQYYKEDAASEVVRNLVSESYPDAIREAGLVPVSSPEIQVTRFEPSQELVYEASFEIRPAIDVKGYAGLELTKDPIEVTDAEVQENLKDLQERMAQLVPIAEARGPRAGDIVAVDYVCLLEEKPIPRYEAKDYLVELGKNYLFPELESGILAMAPGEKKRVPVTYPADWADKEIAGKNVEIEVHLKEIKEKKVPELTDDFAKDLGSFATLDEVKTKIREDVARAKEQQAKNKLRRQVIEKLAAKNEFPVPEGMVRMELEEMLRRVEGNLRSQGMTLEQAGMNREDFFAKSRDEALFRVKGGLLFDAVAQKENIAVAPEEVERRIEEMARLAGQSGDVWKRYYREKNLMTNVEAAVREEKTLDFVLSQSKIKIKS
jgi:trigger factor